MSYTSLEAALTDLEKTGQLLRVKEQVDPELEMASIHLRVHETGGPALLFENVKGSRYRAASNIFGTVERSRYLFRDTFRQVQRLIALKNDPLGFIKKPLDNIEAGLMGINALPLKQSFSKPVLKHTIQISDLPPVKHWMKDGGAFITLPQVYTEDPDRPGWNKSNLGMYRIQMTGNDYKLDREIGLHYQIHRGIGVHQAKANRRGEPLKVSIFVGGPPAHTLAAVMPLPEGMSELTFAGLLGRRRFRYACKDGHFISTDADFVITGEIHPGEVKPEGPFGDHLGYYSLAHDFPVMRVRQVYARDRAIWPFTVVGRPPQEDTSFGALIHELTGDAIPVEIPGLREVNAVDAAGVHPLLLAIGSERYTPYQRSGKPAELLTIAHHILGTGQLSLAKYLIIASDEHRDLSVHNIAAFFRYVLERADWTSCLHFDTNTTMDTLDYSGTGLNSGSKLVIAVRNEIRRNLDTELPAALKELQGFGQAAMAMPGVAALNMKAFTSYEHAELEMKALDEQLTGNIADLTGIALILICDDPAFVAEKLNNFLWVSFTRSNPSHDVYGIRSFVKHKHWGCEGPLIIDARIKPHHAPPLELNPVVEKRVDSLFSKGGSLYGAVK